MYAKAVIKEGSVNIYYKNDGKTLWFSTGVTGISNSDKYWNKKDGKLTAANFEYQQMNLVIAQKCDQVETIIREYAKENNGQKPPTDYVKMVLQGKQVKVKEKKKAEAKKYNSFQEYYKTFYNEKKNEAKVHASLRDYVSNENTLKLYERKNGKLTLEEMATTEFLKKFEKFLANPMEKNEFKSRGCLNDNTIAKRVSYLRTFMNWCEQNNQIVLSPKFKAYKTIVSKYKPTIIILEEDEIKALRELNLKKETDIALRDFMLVLVGTGMRYSDFYGMSKDNIEEGYIVKRSQKTKIVFSVPIIPEVAAILEKYDYRFDRFTNQVYNRMIKDLLKVNNISCNLIKVT